MAQQNQEEEEEGLHVCFQAEGGGRRRRRQFSPEEGPCSCISQLLLLFLLLMKEGVRSGPVCQVSLVVEAVLRGGGRGGRSDLDVLGLHHFGECLLDSEDGEAGCRVLGPTLGHQLQHGPKALVAVPAVGHCGP